MSAYDKVLREARLTRDDSREREDGHDAQYDDGFIAGLKAAKKALAKDAKPKDAALRALKDFKVHVIMYYIEDGEAGIVAIYRSKGKAERHFGALVLDTLDPGTEMTEKEKAKLVKKAIAAGQYEYMGSGQGALPWYALTVKEVQ